MPAKKTNEHFLQEVLEKLGSKFEVIGTYVNAKTNIKMKHYCLDGEICEYQATPTNIISRDGECPRCRYIKSSNSLKMTKEKCQNSLNDKFGINHYLIIEGFVRAGQKAKVKHICGHIWEARISHILNNESGCPVCSETNRIQKRIIPLEKVQNRLNEMYGDNEYLILEGYNGTNKTARVRHSCDFEWNPFINNLLKGEKVCPNCSPVSKGNEKIEKYLIGNNVKYKKEFSFSDCKYKYALRFDFAIFNKNGLICLIEFDGLQHFQPVKSWGGIKALEENKKRDQIKNDYCIKNNIPLLRIPYYEESNINKLLEGFIYNKIPV